ncbi:DUF3093 domain-containing protein [uncultured Tessaracoccus sp.]|uniref:DUF3093 domain-containing protein n=1 Tax=uncultured Tessaracoccus sp. TaxID=905023 RepID=UPI002626AA68|nr:DUF3093 domain-containing protein [uncultured Tessaracoccus sp.]
MTYHERLRAPWLWWLLGAGLVASVILAVFVFVDLWLVITLAVLSTLVVVLGILGFSLVIKVDERGLAVGRYLLEAPYVGRAEIVDGDVRADTDERSFMLTRPYVQQKVRVWIDDPADPHPAWLISTRRPAELVAAIQAVKEH